MAWRCLPLTANRTPATSRSTRWRGCCAPGCGVDGLDGEAARARVRAQNLDADPADLLLLDDLLGVADPDIELPNIEADARRRRLTALVNAASIARREPALYVIEDAHWIDEVSESMLADFLAVFPQTHSMVLITYRPEYQGALATMSGSADDRAAAPQHRRRPRR